MSMRKQLRTHTTHDARNDPTSFETASTCIINALLLLAMHPEYQTILRQEIHEVLSMDITPLTTNGVQTTITMTHLQAMPYLDMILKESLRLLTTVPIILRNVSCDFDLKIKNAQNNGDYTKIVKVPKNTIIAGDIFEMQRSTDVWGPKAREFYPEHFAKNTNGESGTKRHPYAYIPFLKGIRTCIGNRYSIYLSKIILIKLIGSLNLHTSTKLQELEFCEGVSLKYRNSADISFEIISMADDD
ncbi:probable cytochrome P450 313a2 [Musca vetustissima]|uniref:probable cytochrome P450 313a2 n=1 Tax=Musca vetustissima TaxID=27455 RepID=UPI002AB74A86|nr:probable cytochrome P450 313a2 [Musca vetustissima]